MQRMINGYDELGLILRSVGVLLFNSGFIFVVLNLCNLLQILNSSAASSFFLELFFQGASPLGWILSIFSVGHISF